MPLSIPSPLLCVRALAPTPLIAPLQQLSQPNRNQPMPILATPSCPPPTPPFPVHSVAGSRWPDGPRLGLTASWRDCRRSRDDRQHEDRDPRQRHPHAVMSADAPTASERELWCGLGSLGVAGTDLAHRSLIRGSPPDGAVLWNGKGGGGGEAQNSIFLICIIYLRRVVCPFSAVAVQQRACRDESYMDEACTAIRVCVSLGLRRSRSVRHRVRDDAAVRAGAPADRNHQGDHHRRGPGTNGFDIILSVSPLASVRVILVPRCVSSTLCRSTFRVDLCASVGAVLKVGLQAPHAGLLRDHKHVRHMWLPYTDQVVVVMSDPSDSPAVTQHPAVYATGGLLLLLLIYFQSATVFTHALTGALAIRRAATNCDCAYQVPAPSPIEQRWTSASSSFLSHTHRTHSYVRSPAHSLRLHCWSPVGWPVLS